MVEKFPLRQRQWRRFRESDNKLRAMENKLSAVSGQHAASSGKSG
jgi:hypothetical protein